MKKIRTAIIGLGNCASALIQGIGYYSQNTSEKIGLIHQDIGGYTISDIEIITAFDVNSSKIDKKISEAIFEKPNCTRIFYKNRNLFSNKVMAGPILDGISPRMRKITNPHNIKKDISDWEKSIVANLKKHNIDILVSFLPVGAKNASQFYANCAIKAGVAFANAIPEFICSTPQWSKRFENKGLPCAGDDIKSQVGATIIHRTLVSLIRDRGQVIDNTYQLNIGGNTDFMNMLDEDRLSSKRISKTEAVTKLITDYKFSTKIGPSDYVPHLNDNKICYIEINGRQFGGIPFKIDVKLSVEDSPNSAGVMTDVIRLLKVAKDRGRSGYQDFSSYYFKHPKKQYTDNQAKKIVEDFIINIS